jgi:hypothetical protein
VRPDRSRGRVVKNGEAAASGWTAEQTSCKKPGSVSSAERAPPPIVAFASQTKTEQPARASVIAAARPFGPEPTMTASYSTGMLKRSSQLGARPPIIFRSETSRHETDRHHVVSVARHYGWTLVCLSRSAKTSRHAVFEFDRVGCAHCDATRDALLTTMAFPCD